MIESRKLHFSQLRLAAAWLGRLIIICFNLIIADEGAAQPGGNGRRASFLDSRLFQSTPAVHERQHH